MAIPINEVINGIKALPSMSALKVSDFAEENGLADSAAKYFVQKDENERKERLKPTQLRKVFHSLKNVERKVKGKRNEPFDRVEILNILPELAYALGRDLIPKEFYDLMKECLSQQKLKTVDDFYQFMKFLEAILAYHKYRTSK